MRIIILLFLFAMTACTQLPGINKQGHSGITDVDLQWCRVGQDFKLCRISWVDGKEKQNVSLKADIHAGKIDYTASGVAAFQGHQARALVEQVIADNQGKTAKELTPLILKALGGF